MQSAKITTCYENFVNYLLASSSSYTLADMQTLEEWTANRLNQFGQEAEPKEVQAGFEAWLWKKYGTEAAYTLTLKALNSRYSFETLAANLEWETELLVDIVDGKKQPSEAQIAKIEWLKKEMPLF